MTGAEINSQHNRKENPMDVKPQDDQILVCTELNIKIANHNQTVVRHRLTANHNQTVVRPVVGINPNHNQTLVRSRLSANHNQTLVRR
jgi:hypothetical protein